MRTLIVVPTYCEADNITELLQRVRYAKPDADVLVIDDGSPDGTASLVRQMADELGKIAVVERPHKMGLGDAYRTGFTVGLENTYDVLVEMDADLSHDPAGLPLLVDAVEQGADLAIGSRYIEGGSIPTWRRRRRLLSRWGNRYAAFALGLPITDATSGYRAYRADALRNSNFNTTRANGYAFQIELARRIARSGNVVDIPIVFSDRTRGRSKMSLRIAAEAMVLVTWWGFLDIAHGRRWQHKTVPSSPVATQREQGRTTSGVLERASQSDEPNSGPPAPPFSTIATHADHFAMQLDTAKFIGYWALALLGLIIVEVGSLYFLSLFR